MRLQLESYKSTIKQKNKQIQILYKRTGRYRKRILHLEKIIKKMSENKTEENINSELEIIDTDEVMEVNSDETREVNGLDINLRAVDLCTH
jgi:hypothetical protein